MTERETRKKGARCALICLLVPLTRVELARFYPPDPKSGASADSATAAYPHYTTTYKILQQNIKSKFYITRPAGVEASSARQLCDGEHEFTKT